MQMLGMRLVPLLRAEMSFQASCTFEVGMLAEGTDFIVEALVAMPALRSIFLEMLNRGDGIGKGTGFVVVHEGDPYLITNRHNLAGRRSDTDKILDDYDRVPTHVCLTLMSNFAPLEWRRLVVPLRDDASHPLWFEHPFFGRRVDVVALSLRGVKSLWYDYRLFPHQLTDVFEPRKLRTMPTDPVSIIGFPYGKFSYGSLPIWSRGYIASEISLDYAGLPRFLIDARTTSGQSGSPVIAYAPKGPATLADGSVINSPDEITNLLGVYSGRISHGTDIGMVWRLPLIQEIIEGRMTNPEGLEWPAPQKTVRKATEFSGPPLSPPVGATTNGI